MGSDVDWIDVDETDDSPTILERLCGQLPLIIALFALSALGLLLSLVALLVNPPGSDAFTLSILNVVGIVVMLSWTGYVIRRCDQI